VAVRRLTRARGDGGAVLACGKCAGRGSVLKAAWDAKVSGRQKAGFEPCKPRTSSPRGVANHDPRRSPSPRGKDTAVSRPGEARLANAGSLTSRHERTGWQRSLMQHRALEPVHARAGPVEGLARVLSSRGHGFGHARRVALRGGLDWSRLSDAGARVGDAHLYDAHHLSFHEPPVHQPRRARAVASGRDASLVHCAERWGRRRGIRLHLQTCGGGSARRLDR